MSPMHAEHSPDESVRCEGGGNVNVNRITLPPTRDLIIGTMLAFSLLCNIFLYAYAKDAKTIAMLAADALQKFQTTQLPDLQSKITVAEELIKYDRLKESINVDNHHQSGTSEQAARSDRRPSH